jgi:hypothetical protein|tara:strand:- start:492 stop:686 length:195 start_codon:yes stop_codon:yes gene_type:complete
MNVVKAEEMIRQEMVDLMMSADRLAQIIETQNVKINPALLMSLRETGSTVSQVVQSIHDMQHTI